MNQQEFVLEWFKDHTGVDVPHSKSKKEIETLWLMKTGARFEDVDRAIRRLHEEGQLVKVAKGVYRYEPHASTAAISAIARNAILSKAGFRCEICGIDLQNIELVIISRDRSSKALPSNSQVACTTDALAIAIQGALGATVLSKITKKALAFSRSRVEQDPLFRRELLEFLANSGLTAVLDEIDFRP